MIITQDKALLAVLRNGDQCSPSRRKCCALIGSGSISSPVIAGKYQSSASSASIIIAAVIVRHMVDHAAQINISGPAHAMQAGEQNCRRLIAFGDRIAVRVEEIAGAQMFGQQQSLIKISSQDFRTQNPSALSALSTATNGVTDSARWAIWL